MTTALPSYTTPRDVTEKSGRAAAVAPSRGRNPGNAEAPARQAAGDETVRR